MSFVISHYFVCLLFVNELHIFGFSVYFVISHYSVCLFVFSPRNYVFRLFISNRLVFFLTFVGSVIHVLFVFRSAKQDFFFVPRIHVLLPSLCLF